MRRRARARRPTESLEAFLPRFDDDGRHRAEPADLLAAGRADEVLDRKRLAEKARAGLDRLPDMLMDYLEGVLPAADVELVEAHVSGCPRCVAFVESYRQTPRILRAVTAPALPEDLAESLRLFLASRR